jgi:hypothetical protein
MSKSNTWETGLLNLVFCNVSFTGLGDAGGLLKSVADGYLYVSLHTSDPGEAGTQLTNEISYTGYARVGVPRDASHWTVSGNSVVPAATIAFAPMAGGTGGTVTHVGFGTASSGAGKLLMSGTIAPNIPVATPVQPELSTASAITED